MKTRKYIFEISNTFYEKHKIEYRYVVIYQRENEVFITHTPTTNFESNKEHDVMANAINIRLIKNQEEYKNHCAKCKYYTVCINNIEEHKNLLTISDLITDYLNIECSIKSKNKNEENELKILRIREI